MYVASTAAAAASAWSSSSRDDDDDEFADDHQTALLVGLLSFLSLCVAAIAAAFHKRCQQRLVRLVLRRFKTPGSTDPINKTRPNSYKSSPSGTPLCTGRLYVNVAVSVKSKII